MFARHRPDPQALLRHRPDPQALLRFDSNELPDPLAEELQEQPGFFDARRQKNQEVAGEAVRFGAAEEHKGESLGFDFCQGLDVDFDEMLVDAPLFHKGEAVRTDR